MRLDKSKFVAWLRTKPTAEIVGQNRDCHSCPIAHFYEAATGGSEIVIFERWGDYYIDRGYSTRRLPPWAERFAMYVDHDENGQISAGRALAIVEQHCD